MGLRISHGDQIAIGPGKVQLLEAIRRAGSISAAAKEIGMSRGRAGILMRTVRAKTDASPVPPATEQVRHLTARAAQHVLAEGLGDLSLRGIAPALGTSHRMLIYHFGSADLFWEAVLREIRHMEQDWRRQSHKPRRGQSALEAAWERFSSPDYLPIIQLLFEIYGRAIRDTARYEAFLDDVVSSWLKPVQTYYVRRGLPLKEARARARLQVAVVRGLLLDLVTTGNRRQTTTAMRYFVELLQTRDG